MSLIETQVIQPGKSLPLSVLEAIIANTADAVLALAPNGRILVFNREAKKIYGAQHQIIGRRFAEVCLQDENLDPINDLILRAIGKPNEILDEDVVIELPDSSQRHFNVRTRLLVDTDQQQHLGLFVVLSDITLRIEATRERAESGMFLATIIIALLISESMNVLVLNAFPSIDIYSNAFVWLYTITTCVPVLGYILWTKKPMSEFGVTRHQWKTSFIEALSVSLVFLLLGAAVLMVIGVRQEKTLTDFINTQWLQWETLSYIPHSILQEFVFRGVVLTALVRMFRDNPLWKPLVLSSLLFAFMHIQFGAGAILVTFVVGIAFGLMYLRHNNIVGVSLAHILLGSSAFIFGIL